jgi:hypothetical protein
MTLRESSVVLFVFSFACSSTSVRKIEPDSPEPVAAVSIEVYADGRDADQPPGPRITEGETIEWTFVAVNTGTVELTNVEVTTDAIVENDAWYTVNCSRTAINPGEQSLCFFATEPEVGLNETTGAVTAVAPDGSVVTASDSSYVLVDGISVLAPGEVRPAICDTSLLLANPTRDSLSEIELASRAAAIVAVADEPLDLVVADDCSTAVTLNDGGATVSVIDLAAGTATTLAVRPGRNRLELSPDGAWAVAWLDPKREGVGCVGVDTCALGEISLVDLTNLTVESFATGLEPWDVFFAPDSGRAVLVADAFLGLLELGGSVTYARHGTNTVSIDEAVLGPNGDYVWLRDADMDALVVATLSPFALDTSNVGLVSDIALTANGAHLIAVTPDADEILAFDTSAPLATAPTAESALLDATTQLRLAQSGDVGVLFVEDGSTDEIVVWLRGSTVSRGPLAKPVRDVELTADGSAALVVHTLEDVDGVDDEHTDQYLVSVLDTGSSPLSSNVIALPSRPIAWALAPTGGWGVVAAEGSTDLVVIDLGTGLIDVLELPEPAHYAGFLPNTGTVDDDVAWLSHAFDITFISPASGSVETVSP